MKPLNTLILIEYEEPTEKKTDSGLYVPPTSGDQALGFLREAKVLAVNPKEEHIKEGDTVLFNINAAAKLNSDKTKRLVRSEDIYAIV